MRPKLFHATGLCCATLLLAGCVTNAMRDATADFADASHAATQNQKQWITAYTDLRREELRQSWAEDRLKMIFNPSCARILTVDDPEALSNLEEDCAIGLAESGQFKALNDFERFDAILGLNDALGDYADSLIDLTQDWSDDRELLTEEERKTDVALQGLHSAIGKFAEVNGEDIVQQAPDIGGILGTIAGAYLETKRLKALRGILQSADPMVEQASGFLHEAQELALAQDRKDALMDLDAAVDALRGLPSAALRTSSSPCCGGLRHSGQRAWRASCTAPPRWRGRSNS